tara:strand:- start:888 stop:1439 length:552 start_codon:yes stop_codon:yes gene_type:complete
MDSPLSDGDIQSVLGKFKPIAYSDLKNYNTIEELLPNDYDWRIILLETSQNSGHWVCIMRVPDKYVYFNSYGDSFNKDLYLIPRMIRKILGQNENYLNNLLRGKVVEFSSIKFQGDKSSVCGRYCLFFIDYICNLHHSLKDAISFLKSQKKDLKLKSYDETIIALTNHVKPTDIKLEVLKGYK